MTPVRWLGVAEAAAGGGGNGARGTAASARTHPHMPRRRKSTSPARASGGSGSPSAALRKVSYWAATLDGSADRDASGPALTAAFFFHARRARWSGDAP